MRFMFFAYLVLIVAGITYFAVSGLPTTYLRFLKHNGLSIFFGTLFLGALLGQAVAGHDDFNEKEIVHARLAGEEPDTISFGRYLTSSNFGQAVMENWQSEYLKFTLFVLATVGLIQKGSPESKEPRKAGTESEKDQRLGSHADEDSPIWARVGGLRTFLFSNSLLLVMGAIFLASWLAHSSTGWTEYNAEQVEHEQSKVSWWGYIGAPHDATGVQG